MQIFNKLIYIIKNIKMIQLYYFGYLNHEYKINYNFEYINFT